MLQSVFHSIFRRPLREALTLYGYALAIVIVGMTGRALLHPLLGSASFAITLVSVLTAAWICGVGPCLLVQTIVILIESNAYPRNNGEPRTLSSAVVGIGVFYFVGLAMALLSEFTRIARLRAVREAENANRERERLLATLNCVADAVLVTSAEGIVTLANPVAEAMLRQTADRLVGRPIDSVLPLRSEQGEDVPSPIEQVMKAGKTVHCDASMWLKRDDGSSLPVSLSASPVRDSGGVLQGNVFLLHDQSERVRIEEELREADRRKDEFLATLAHELRNPLAPIRTGLELLKLCGDDPSLFDDVRGRMERQTIHMVRLIDDLLDVSRITRGKLKLERSFVELAQVVRCAVEAVQPLIDERRHHLTVSLPREPVWWHVDEHRMAQIISNLLSNASRFTPPGGTIQLTAAQQAGQVIVRVKDTGAGIPAEMHERIFDMFTQVQRTMENGSGGLGIGLTLVKTLVEMHGGVVRVLSNGAGQGSEFIIEVPACHPLDTPTPAALAAPSLPAAEARPVLVVDDNRDAAQSLALLVKALGYDVAVAYDGVEALATAEQMRPQIVVMDLGMPRMDGLEAARLMREQAWGKDLFLVAVTGWGKEEDRHRSRQAGFNDHLVKPVELARLQAAMAACNGQAELSSKG